MTNHEQAPLHVVLGAGQIGTRVARLLVARGFRVRMVNRSARETAPAGVEVVAGDITDHAFAGRAAAGASVVYDCMNPPYHRWPELLLPLASGALHAASRSGAKLVALDCLYMYGRPSGPISEDSPFEPCSRKGALRVTLGELRLAAHQRGDVRLAIGRASDFFGSNLPFSAFSERFWQRVRAGKAAECMGDPDMPHSYTYVEDIARALVTLGEREEALGRVWHLPTPPAESTRALNARLGRSVGLEIRTERVPRWLLRAIGVFSPFMREVHEMTYQWDVPFVLDDSRFRATFGQSATPIDDAVTEVARWARAHMLPTVAQTGKAHAAGSAVS